MHWFLLGANQGAWNKHIQQQKCVLWRLLKHMWVMATWCSSEFWLASGTLWSLNDVNWTCHSLSHTHTFAKRQSISLQSSPACPRLQGFGMYKDLASCVHSMSSWAHHLTKPAKGGNRYCCYGTGHVLKLALHGFSAFLQHALHSM